MFINTFVLLFHTAIFFALYFYGSRLTHLLSIGNDVPRSSSTTTVRNLVSPSIEIYVFLYNRVNATKRLLSQLHASNYSSYHKPISLILHLDRPRDGEGRDTSDWLSSIEIQGIISQFQWSYGPKYIDTKDSNEGLKSAWLTAWPAPNPDDIMIAFEDDIEVSLLYFQFLIKVLNEYHLWRAAMRDPRLLGLCLSPVPFDEITEQKAERLWSSSQNIPLEFPVYLHALPCSWGAVYFGDQWRQFLSFHSVRGSPPFYEHEKGAEHDDPQIRLPNSRSNTWIKSWKRFMFDFAYGRGGYLLYPNLKDGAALARTLCLPGVHYVTPDPRLANIPIATNVDGLYLDVEWPSYDALPLIDLYYEPIDRASYVERGTGFVENIRVLGPEYERLANVWRGGIG